MWRGSVCFSSPPPQGSLTPSYSLPDPLFLWMCRRVQPRSPFNAFIVRLESPDEAQRLVREMQHAKLGGAPISIVLYK